MWMTRLKKNTAGVMLAGEIRSTQRKPCTSDTANPTWSGLFSIRTLRG